MHCFLLLLHEGSPSFLFLSLGDVLTEACSETSSTKELIIWRFFLRETKFSLGVC